MARRMNPKTRRNPGNKDFKIFQESGKALPFEMIRGFDRSGEFIAASFKPATYFKTRAEAEAAGTRWVNKTPKIKTRTNPEKMTPGVRRALARDMAKHKRERKLPEDKKTAAYLRGYHDALQAIDPREDSGYYMRGWNDGRGSLIGLMNKPGYSREYRQNSRR